MACYHPIPASQDRPGAPVRLGPPLGEDNLALPCGTCIGCKTDRATHWANRCTHEASRWNHNSFITLTYDDEHLPQDAGLRPRDLQLFIKRLRKNAQTDSTTLVTDPAHSLRYFACGEYGTENGRPHYHALIFNGAWADQTKVGKDLYTSEQLSQLWPYGHNRIGECTPRSAAYVAQYTLKKNRGQYPHPGYMDLKTGEYSRKRKPGFTRYDDGSLREPFLRMSLKPAIGADWLKQYATDLQHGYLVEGGRKHPVPRYYRDKLKDTHPELHEQLEYKMAQHRQHLSDKRHPDRLRDTEIIHTRRKQILENRDL